VIIGPADLKLAPTVEWSRSLKDATRIDVERAPQRHQGAVVLSGHQMRERQNPVRIFVRRLGHNGALGEGHDLVGNRPILRDETDIGLMPESHRQQTGGLAVAGFEGEHGLGGRHEVSQSLGWRRVETRIRARKMVADLG
jgi:hypothetical protein